MFCKNGQTNPEECVVLPRNIPIFAVGESASHCPVTFCDIQPRQEASESHIHLCIFGIVSLLLIRVLYKNESLSKQILMRFYDTQCDWLRKSYANINAFVHETYYHIASW